MIEVSLLALVSAAFALVVPFLVLVGIMLNLLTGTQRRIEDRLDHIDDRLVEVHSELAKLGARVTVLEERGRPQHVEA